MAQPAYQTTQEVIDALTEGISTLDAQAAAAQDPRRKQLNFCEGCLIELRDALTESETDLVRDGVNSGCKG